MVVRTEPKTFSRDLARANPNGEKGVGMATIAQIKAKGTISVSDNVSFSCIVDVLNGVFNCSYGGYQFGAWPRNYRNSNKMVWFPKLSLDNGKPVAKEWDNYFFNKGKIYICQRRMLTDKNQAKICQNNPTHYNDPLDCLKAGKPIPLISSGCSISHNDKKIAVFAKVNNKNYIFFGVYKFIGIQTVQYENIIRKSSYCIKGKYIEVYEKISEELNINEWV